MIFRLKKSVQFNNFIQMNTLSISKKRISPKPACEICLRPEKTLLISGVKICAGCKSAYYRHSQKLLVFLLTSMSNKSDAKQQLADTNDWSSITDIIHRFLTENYKCGVHAKYTNSQNCTTIGNFKCKACKLVKISLKLRNFPSNLNNFGQDIKELIDNNKELIFDDLVERFQGCGLKDRKRGKRENLELENLKPENMNASKMVFQIPIANTLPQPNIHTSVIDYICRSLDNSDKHFIFQNQQQIEPLMFLDNTYHNVESGVPDPDIIRNQMHADVHADFNTQLKQKYNTCMEYTENITALLLKELFSDCGLPDFYFTTLLKLLGPTLTSLRALASYDFKNRFRIAPEGMISVSSTSLYAILVSMFGLDKATVILKGYLSLAETLRGYSFYLIVLLNVYLAISMCDSSELFFMWRQVKGSVVINLKSKLSQRKEMLMIGVQTITDKLNVRRQFDEILSALKTFNSDMFGVKISVLD